MELRLKELQEKKEISNAELSRMLLAKFGKKEGVGLQQINYYRAGTRNPPLTTIQKLAEVLDCNFHELLEAGEGFEHEYYLGEWIGIRKK